MADRSIYMAENAAAEGGSPQARHEQRWAKGRRNRLIARAAIAVAAGVAAGLAFGPLAGLICGVLVAAAHAAWYAWRRMVLGPWRRGGRGVSRTRRILALGLRRGHGVRVLHGRLVPGRAPEAASTEAGTGAAEIADHVIIGPGGVWLVVDSAHGPGSETAVYSGKLFLGKRPGRQLVQRVAGRAARAGAALAGALGRDVPVTPVLAMHGSSLPWRGRVIGGVRLLRAAALPHLVTHAPAHYDEDRVDRLAMLTARLLPPA